MTTTPEIPRPPRLPLDPAVQRLIQRMKHQRKELRSLNKALLRMHHFQTRASRRLQEALDLAERTDEENARLRDRLRAQTARPWWKLWG